MQFVAKFWSFHFLMQFFCSTLSKCFPRDLEHWSQSSGFSEETALSYPSQQVMPAFVIINSSCYHGIKYAKNWIYFKAKFRTDREQNYFALWNTLRKGCFLMWFVQYFSRNDFRACLLVNTVDRSNQLANMQIIHSCAICHAFPYVWFWGGWKWYFSKERLL